MKKFVIFLLTALLALSGCKGGDGAELELIKEDILAERFDIKMQDLKLRRR